MTPEEDAIRQEEGWHDTVYRDIRGVLTIGYGFNVDPDRSGYMPQRIGDIWLRDEIEWRKDDLTELFGPVVWEQMGGARRAALTSMHYQLGAAGFRSFGRMVAAARKMDWRGAARECLDSRAARQTPARYDRNAKALLTGEWQWS